MVEQGNRKAFSTFSSLRRFAEEESERAAKKEAEAAQEHCDLCGELIPPEHRPHAAAILATARGLVDWLAIHQDAILAEAPLAGSARRARAFSPYLSA